MQKLNRREFLSGAASAGALMAGGRGAVQTRRATQPDLSPRRLALNSFADAQPTPLPKRRLEAPYTLSVETPHVPWARPLAGGPIRLLAVPTVREGRTLVELAQRLSLDLTTVTIDSSWDLNTWTMCFGSDYGQRAEKGDLHLIYSYLEEELTGEKQFDAILLPINHGWNRLTPASRTAIERRVREGCGLVLVRPDRAPVSPLTPEAGVPFSEDEHAEPAIPGEKACERSPWRRVGDHYITRAIPVETFPFDYLENYIYHTEPGATVLVASATGHPILATGEYGKGRVVAFAYRNNGLSWEMPMAARIHPVDLSWEYFYAMFCRSLVYAAGREPLQPADWNAATTRWRVKSESGQLMTSGDGPRPPAWDLPPGRYFLELQAPSDWQITPIEVPQTDKIEHLRCAPEMISEGDDVDVNWKAPRPVTIELIDGFGRVIGRDSGSGRLVLRAGRPLTHSGQLRATLGAAVEHQAVSFAASSRAWTDYEVILPWIGPYSYQPWVGVLDEQFRRIGVTTVAEPDRNFKLMVDVDFPGFGLAWRERGEYLKRKAAFAQTGDTRYLTRDVTLESEQFEMGLERRVNTRVKPVARLKPFAYYMADESSLTAFGDAFDVDWAPEALAAFRMWLRREYRTLDTLNASWGTEFRAWEHVLPMTTAQAQKHGNYAPWSDHRLFMEQDYANAWTRAKALIRKEDPEARVSISGTQEPSAHNGCNWYEIDQRLDYLQPYSGGGQDYMHPLFHPGMPITGFTGYGGTDGELHYEQWQRLFAGHTGASIFWHYTLLNPDLTLTRQGEALAAVYAYLQSGIGRLFMNSRLHEDGVAIHFSMASIRGAWISDGRILPDQPDEYESSRNAAELGRRRDAWVTALLQQGVQFRFLATPEIEAGALDRFRVLIMPYSISISDKEADEIRRFLRRGGVVYADEHMGRMDERCRWRPKPTWTGTIDGLKSASSPVDLRLPPPLGIQGDFVRTVRDFGESLLVGLLPKEGSTTLKLPPTARVRYDLFRGGLADDVLEASPEKPILLLERPSRIASLDLDSQFHMKLTDENGEEVDRSVVHVDVFDPVGKPVRHYSGNADVVKGAAQFSVPFAWNDTSGRWRIRARDVISGLEAEREVLLTGSSRTGSTSDVST